METAVQNQAIKTTRLKLSKIWHAGSVFIVVGFVHLLIYMPQENIQFAYRRASLNSPEKDSYLAADSLKFVSFLFYQFSLTMAAFTYLWKSRVCQIVSALLITITVVLLFLSFVVQEGAYGVDLSRAHIDRKTILDYKRGVLVMSLLHGFGAMVMYCLASCRCCEHGTFTPPAQQISYNEHRV